MSRQPMSRRDFIKVALAGTAGALGTLGYQELKRKGFHIDVGFAPALTPMPGTEIPTPTNIIPTPVGGGEALPQVAAPESLVYPDRWAETPQAAAELFGGKAEYWRKDIYVDPQDGQTKWGGTWVMEAYQLKTQFKADGLYVDQFGKPLPQDQIYDFNNLLERVDVDFGPYAETYQAHGTSWDGQMYKAGTGHAVFDQAVQAVIRPITLKCIEGSDVVAQLKDEAKQRTAEEFSRYLFNDPQADSLVAGLWDETKGKFKLLSGVGWRASLSSLLVGFFFGPEKGGDKLA